MTVLNLLNVIGSGTVDRIVDNGGEVTWVFVPTESSSVVLTKVVRKSVVAVISTGEKPVAGSSEVSGYVFVEVVSDTAVVSIELIETAGVLDFDVDHNFVVRELIDADSISVIVELPVVFWFLPSCVDSVDV